MITKIQLIDDIKDVWKYATMQVQYVATMLVAVWVTLTPEQQSQFLSAIGLSADKFALVSIGMLVASTVLARITTAKKNAPAAD